MSCNQRFWNQMKPTHRYFSKFKTAFIYHYLELSFEVYISFLPQLASKWQAVESGSPEKVPGKGAFYYINHHNSDTFFRLRTLMACHF